MTQLQLLSYLSVVGDTILVEENMEVRIDWTESFPLRTLSSTHLETIRQQLDAEPGIYVFARRWGKTHEALYVGQAQNIAGRLKTQFNNRGLIDHVAGAKIGAKVLLVGYLNYAGFTNRKKSLDIAERAYIRYAISQNHFLHNKQGTRIRTNQVTSTGGSKRTIFPKLIEVEST